MSIGKRIKKYRKEKKLTQAQLSEAVGIPLTTLQRYERGESTPPFDRVMALAEALGVFWQSLLFEPKALPYPHPLAFTVSKLFVFISQLSSQVDFAFKNNLEEITLFLGGDFVSISIYDLNAILEGAIAYNEYLIQKKGTPKK